MTQQTLKLQGAGMPPIILDRCTQVLEVLPLGGLHRTVNGELIYTGLPQQTKYHTLCTGSGKMAPGLGTLHRGDLLTVHCIQRLWQEVSTQTVNLSRPAVRDTVLVIDDRRQSVAFTMVSDTELRLTHPPAQVFYLSYCPLLTMRVVEITFNAEEWADTQGWKVSLEEV